MSVVVTIQATTAERLYSKQAHRFEHRPLGAHGVLPVTQNTLQTLHNTLEPMIEHPWWVSHASSEGSFNGILWVDAGLSYFSGHFPGAPILPGVVQVHWALDIARVEFGLEARFSGMRNLKFKAPTRPNTWLRMELVAKQNAVEFLLRDHREVRTQGRLNFDDH